MPIAGTICGFIPSAESCARMYSFDDLLALDPIGCGTAAMARTWASARCAENSDGDAVAGTASGAFNAKIASADRRKTQPHATNAGNNDGVDVFCCCGLRADWELILGNTKDSSHLTSETEKSRGDISLVAR